MLNGETYTVVGVMPGAVHLPGYGKCTARG